VSRSLAISQNETEIRSTSTPWSTATVEELGVRPFDVLRNHITRRDDLLADTVRRVIREEVALYLVPAKPRVRAVGRAARGARQGASSQAGVTKAYPATRKDR